jgi:hypothetical protein
LLPRRLKPEARTLASRIDWQDTQVRVPGKARRRRSGMASPHSSQDRIVDLILHRAIARPTASHRISSFAK